MTDIQITQADECVFGPQVETLNYGVECTGCDYGLITARNQLISRVINPLIDTIMETLKPDHIVDSGTTYKVAVVITSTREIDTVQ